MTIPINVLHYLTSLTRDKNKVILIAVVSALIIIGDYTFLLKGQLSGLRSATTKIIKTKKDLAEATREVGRVKSGAGGQQAPVKIKKMLSEDAIEDLMEEIDVLAKENKINIIQVKRSGESSVGKDAKVKKDKGAPKETNIPLLIILDVVGDYHNLGTFLNQLENGEKLISVEEMTINAEADNSLLQEAHFVLKTYVKSNPARK